LSGPEPKQSLLVQEVELTIERTLPIWWDFVWLALLVTVATSVVVGAVLGFVSAIVVSIWAMRSAMSKSYGNHCVVLVKR
jgi:hypothetical protein